MGVVTAPPGPDCATGKSACKADHADELESTRQDSCGYGTAGDASRHRSTASFWHASTDCTSPAALGAKLTHCGTSGNAAPITSPFAADHKSCPVSFKYIHVLCSVQRARVKPQAAVPSGQDASHTVVYASDELGSAAALHDQLPPPAGAGSAGHAGELGVGVMVMVGVTDGVPVIVMVTDGV